MITIKLPYISKDSNFIETIQKQYSNVLRYSYNRFLEGKSQKDIRLLCKSLKNIELLNSWIVQCAIKDAEAIYIKNKDKSKVIFGSRKQFYRRIKGFINNNDLKQSRLSSINIQGEMFKQGNRSFKLDIINNNCIIFKVSNDNHISLDLPNLRNNYRKLLHKLESQNYIKQGKPGHTYSIRISKEFIYITFMEPVNNNLKLLENRYLGIDLNPNEIGVSIKEDDKILQVRRYILNIKENNHGKIEYELFQISKKISNLFKSYNCKYVFIEDLAIKSKEHGKGKSFNRQINNQWIRNKFINNLEKRINIFGGKLFKINPAYSSFIGNMMHNFVDSINASLEIGRRGYEVIILKNKKFYPEFNLSSLKDQWKEHISDGVKDWKEFFLKIKNLKLKYRVSLDNKVFSHMSKKSGVNYYFYLV